MSKSQQHARLRPLIMHIIEKWEPEMAANMILGLVLNEDVLAAPLPEPRKRATKSSAKGGNGRSSAAEPAAELDEIDPNRRYSRVEAARLMGMTEGAFSPWYAVPGNIEVIRDNDGGGRPRVFFMGSEIQKARDKRNGMKKVAAA